MAGGFKNNPKNKGFIKSILNSETLNSFPSNNPDKKTNRNGVLTPGQSVDFNPPTPDINWNKEFTFNSNYIETDHNLIIQRQGQEISQSIEEIRSEIKKLINTIKGMDQELSTELTNVPLTNIPENNQYQLTFLNRIKRIIENFRQNISEASVWMTAFNSKRSKQNSFWGRARNKKSGGQQYMFSGEHSASRSVN